MASTNSSAQPFAPAADALLRSDLGEVGSSPIVQNTTRLRAHLANLEREQQSLDAVAIEAWRSFANLGVDLPSLGLSWSTGRPDQLTTRIDW